MYILHLNFFPSFQFLQLNSFVPWWQLNDVCIKFVKTFDSPFYSDFNFALWVSEVFFQETFIKNKFANCNIFSKFKIMFHFASTNLFPSMRVIICVKCFYCHHLNSFIHRQIKLTSTHIALSHYHQFILAVLFCFIRNF